MCLSMGRRGKIRYYDVQLWNVETGGNIIFPTENNKGCSDRFSRDGTIFAGISSNGTIKLWSVKMGFKIRTLPGNGRVSSIRFSPDSTVCASGLLDGQIRLWRLIDLEDLKQLSILDLLLVNTCKYYGIIDLKKKNPELYKRYKKASKLVKSLIP